MASIPYDPSRKSLLQPGAADDFFQLGRPQSHAALCAEMSRLAYVKEKPRLEHYLNKAGFNKDRAIGYENMGTQAFIASKNDGTLTVVAFRGSEPDDPSDIFADANFRMTNWTGPSDNPIGKVHAGFAEFSRDDNVFTQVMVHIGSLPPAHRILLTGHSLGAALATLVASHTPSAHLYTFGSPRVGNRAFAQSLTNEVSVRFANCCDIVTRLPPEEVFGYAHVGTLAYFDQNGTRLASPDDSIISADRIQASAQYLARHALRWGTVFSRDLADHAPINYVSAAMGARASD